ncbi:MAG: NAD(P)H-hydrate dehydratase [Bacillota bacterium]
MYLVTGEEMRKLDQDTIQNYFLSSMVLMEQAALRVAELASFKLNNQLANKRILVFTGKGNNGGDGFAAARLLSQAGAIVSVFMICRPEELTGDALTNYRAFQRFGGKTRFLQRESDLQRVALALINTDLIIDALYGTGFKGNVTGLAMDLLNMLNENNIPIIAVDLPSGLHANTGQVGQIAIRANATVTFGLPKIGLLLEPGASFAGELWLGDISLPAQLIKKADLKTQLISEELCQGLLPLRPSTGHKGTFGHVFAVGGSEGMTGAICLAAEAALRTGSGLVTAGIPRSLNYIMEIKTTEIMTKPLPETEVMSIGLEALEPILSLQGGIEAYLFGPGMFRHPSTGSLLKAVLGRLERPAVLDADALNLLRGENLKELFRNVKGPLVITPHPGEMAGLLGVQVKDVQADRVQIAKEAARDWQVVVVLKGAKTLVADPLGNLYVNSGGNSGLATGGSGDVLAGMVASFLGQGLKTTEAAILAVYLHGLAGDLAAEQKGHFSLTAGDLLDFLPMAFLNLKQGSADKQPIINERLIKIG